MLKKQLPTTPQARFNSKSIKSLLEAVSEVQLKPDYLGESPFAGGGGFAPSRKGGGRFGSPATTDPSGKGGKTPSHSGKNDPGAYLKYGLGIPAALHIVGGGLRAGDDLFTNGALGIEIATAGIAGALGLGMGAFGAKGSPIDTTKFRGSGRFRGI